MKCNLLINGNIITMDPQTPRVRWVAVDSGKIVYAGNAEPTGFEPQNVLKLDENNAMLPGFIDSHVHGSDTGLYLSSVKLKGAKSVADVLDIVEERCRNTDETLILGMDISEERLKEGRLPYMWELDTISHGKDVLLNHETLHGSCCNSSFWNKLPLDLTMPDIERLDDGRFTGLLLDGIPYERTYNYMFQCIDAEAWFRNILAVSEYAFSCGITTIHTLNGNGLKDKLDVRAVLDRQDEVPLHMVQFIEDFDISLAKEHHLKQVGGCLCLDGSRVIHTAAVMEPYADRPELKGSLYFPDDMVYQFVHDAHVNHMQSSMHAVGDRAINQLIYAIRRVIMEEGGHDDLRHRIEHFALPTHEQIEMAAELGIVCSMQPAFPLLWDIPGKSQYERVLGLERTKRCDPIANVVKAGVVVCAGSDSPVTDMNPLKAIDYLVNTDLEHRKLSVNEALKLYTVNGAYAGHEEDERGSVTVGKHADFVVLSKDPFVFSKEIKDMEIRMTISDGKIVYQADHTA